MKVGIVGVGKWGLTLARKLTEAGAEVIAYDRAGGAPFEGLGRRMKWQDMVASKEIEAVVSAAPPPVTTEIFYACQREKKPCLLTKPLLHAGNTAINATTFVDYVHLHSNLYLQIFRNAWLDGGIESMHAECSGPGPVRSFKAAVDYGVHALAMVLQMHPTLPEKATIVQSILNEKDGREMLWAEMTFYSSGIGGYATRATILAGNDRPTKMTSLLVTTKQGRELRYVEVERFASVYVDGKLAARDARHDPLKNLVERFLCDAACARIDRRWVDISRVAANALDDAISQAKPG